MLSRDHKFYLPTTHALGTYNASRIVKSPPSVIDFLAVTQSLSWRLYLNESIRNDEEISIKTNEHQPTVDSFLFSFAGTTSERCMTSITTLCRLSILTI